MNVLRVSWIDSEYSHDPFVGVAALATECVWKDGSLIERLLPIDSLYLLNQEEYLWTAGTLDCLSMTVVVVVMWEQLDLWKLSRTLISILLLSTPSLNPLFYFDQHAQSDTLIKSTVHSRHDSLSVVPTRRYRRTIDNRSHQENPDLIPSWSFHNNIWQVLIH